MAKKVIISACLLGEQCRYDGKEKGVNAVVEAFKNYEIIPFCPETPLFGTPRERISVVEIDGENRIMTDETARDVTSLLKEEIEKFCAQYPDVDAIVLKSKSPSCGYGTTPVLNENRAVLHYGNGIATDIFLKQYPNIPIQSELSFI